MADTELQQLVTKAVEESVPKEHHGALAFVATTDGVEAVVTVKVGDSWEIVGTTAVSYDGALDAGVKLQFSW